MTQVILHAKYFLTNQKIYQKDFIRAFLYQKTFGMCCVCVLTLSHFVALRILMFCPGDL